jgi:hypothetical protein
VTSEVDGEIALSATAVEIVGLEIIGVAKVVAAAMGPFDVVMVIEVDKMEGLVEAD